MGGEGRGGEGREGRGWERRGWEEGGRQGKGRGREEGRDGTAMSPPFTSAARSAPDVCYEYNTVGNCYGKCSIQQPCGTSCNQIPCAQEYVSLVPHLVWLYHMHI